MAEKVSRLDQKIRSKGPTDGALANRRRVKELFDKIAARKDRIIERNARGRPIYGYRSPIELTGVKEDIEAQVRDLEDACIAKYVTKQGTEVYVVLCDIPDPNRPDSGRTVATAIYKGKAIWSQSNVYAENLIEETYSLFPMEKPMVYDPNKHATEMRVEELKEVIRRKEEAIQGTQYTSGERLPEGDFGNKLGATK